MVYNIQLAINAHANKEKALFLPQFFKAYAGGYGEGDTFIGVAVPHLRKTARAYCKTISLEEIEQLLQSPVHEYRLTAIFILVLKFKKSKEETERKEIIDIYLANFQYVNNWDLVDSSAADLLGAYLYNKPKDLLYSFAATDHLWKQRAAIIATYYFIKQHQFTDTLAIAQLLLHHPHDLIHKAVGWMLREVGNRNKEVEMDFLKTHYRTMPRTALRYAIEKFHPELRQQFLKGFL